MRTLLPLLFSLSVARSFCTIPPHSPTQFQVLSLADGETNNGSNRFRTATIPTSTSSDIAPAMGSGDPKTTGPLSKIAPLWNKVKAASFVWSLAAFLLGYRLGGKPAAGPTTARAAARRYPVIATILLVVAVRDAWSLVPEWAKKNVRWIRRGQPSPTRTEAVPLDPDDLTSFPAISMKLRSLYQRGREKLASGEEIENPGLVFLALLQVMSQRKQQIADSRDRTYHESGREVEDPRQVLQGMDDYFEYADWAYDELPEGQTLKGNLQAKGYSLLRHEKTALPGHVAHYIAVSTERKEALISIKGTSGFEDMLTDCCGNSVRYQFQGASFIEGGRREISCHEGVLLSSKRLAEDLLTFVQSVLLPSGYRITVTGHSLGAGVAVIFAMILRSQIRELRTGPVDKLQVLSFASPPILDYEASKDCMSFVTTFINNSDLIPRSSLSNLVLLVEFMKTVSRRLDEEGLRPRDMKSTAAFVKWLTQGKHGEMLFTPDQMQTAFEQTLSSVNIDDPDHLYVAGRVVHMFDEWTKEGYGNKSYYGNDFEESKKVPTAEKVYIADGTAKTLRIIEIDDRMMSDHMSAGYRTSIRSLLNKADSLSVKPTPPTTQ